MKRWRYIRPDQGNHPMARPEASEGRARREAIAAALGANRARAAELDEACEAQLWASLQRAGWRIEEVGG